MIYTLQPRNYFTGHVLIIQNILACLLIIQLTFLSENK